MLATVQSTLQTVPEVSAAIAAGESLFLAGTRELLSQLPKGNWVGGTIPYFMTEEGCKASEGRIHVTRAPEFSLGANPADYDAANLADLYREAPAHGFTYLVIPASTEVHKTFAEKASLYEGFLLKPTVGWVAGTKVEQIGKEKPAVFNGKTGAIFEDRCVALHVALPANYIVDLEIVNIFESGGGDTIRFEESGFQAGRCLVNGHPANLADYIVGKGIHTEFPLVGDYNGSPINVSIQAVNPKDGTVDLYAPVFPGIDYHFARPIEDYAKAFATVVPNEGESLAFACNCVLNYLYGKLEGHKVGNLTGPITFGEIAHQLLNQTMVRLNLLKLD